jgi:hypothetical protein
VALLRVISTRRAAVAGLVVFTVAIVFFATTDHLAILMASALTQGVVSGILWTASTSWLVRASVRELQWHCWP